MTIVDNAFREWIADFKATNPGVADSRAILDTAQYAFAAGRKAQREIDAARQPVGVDDATDRALGETIEQRDRCEEVADELADHIARITGVDIGEHSSANCPWQNAIDAAEEYKPAQAVDLGQLPDGWRLSKKATCYQLSHGNEIVGNLVGPDAEENAAIIARVLDSKAVGNG